ncbi:MAG: anthranilate synthase component I family protein [Nitrospiraceae bacterium]|nr:anthranilate synthase component I family protein [Nitrospiraceae bacterium]
MAAGKTGSMDEQTFRPLYREIPYERPDALFPLLRARNSILFESVKGSEQTGRYSFIGFDPYLVLTVKDGLVEVESGGRKTLSTRKPLQRLRELLLAYRQEPVEDLPPFQGGAAGMLTYDFVHYLERLPKNAVDDLALPEAHFFMIDRLVAFDHKEEKSWVVVCPGVRNTRLGYSEIYADHEFCVKEAEETLEQIVDRIRRGDASQPGKTVSGSGLPRPEVNVRHDVAKGRYEEMVRKAKDYIAAGDIFQANLSLRVSAEVGGIEPWDLYTTLREVNPSPFSSFIDFGDYQIVSSSPERLVRVRDGVIDTRPIAGTRPRGRDSREDDAMRAELLLNEKERAEHIMLIDLERNDIGRVSDYGSVLVDELMVTEDYSHVMHIVSNVRGRLAEGKDCFDVIKATFPGGTITGVPKVRCMEIIDEIEPFRRGPYTGSLGYIGFNGNMDLNIIIRTFLVKDGMAYIQAGAGIVADSDPEREYYESLKKAEALIRTLERMQRGLR